MPLIKEFEVASVQSAHTRSRSALEHLTACDDNHARQIKLLVL